MSGYDIAELFEKAIDWEVRMRDLYQTFATSFAAHPAVSEFWNAMAADEVHHATVLLEVCRELDPEALAVEVDADTLGLVASVDSVFAQAAAAVIVTLDDAYEVAHEIESSEIETVFRLLTVEGVSSRAKREILEIQMDEHHTRLEAFGRSSQAEHRRSIFAG